MPSERMKRKLERYNRKIEKYQKKIEKNEDSLGDGDTIENYQAGERLIWRNKYAGPNKDWIENPVAKDLAKIGGALEILFVPGMVGAAAVGGDALWYVDQASAIAQTAWDRTLGSRGLGGWLARRAEAAERQEALDWAGGQYRRPPIIDNPYPRDPLLGAERSLYAGNVPLVGLSIKPPRPVCGPPTYQIKKCRNDSDCANVGGDGTPCKECVWTISGDFTAAGFNGAPTHVWQIATPEKVCISSGGYVCKPDPSGNATCVKAGPGEKPTYANKQACQYILAEQHNIFQSPSNHNSPSLIPKCGNTNMCDPSKVIGTGQPSSPGDPSLQCTPEFNKNDDCPAQCPFCRIYTNPNGTTGAPNDPNRHTAKLCSSDVDVTTWECGYDGCTAVQPDQGLYAPTGIAMPPGLGILQGGLFGDEQACKNYVSPAMYGPTAKCTPLPSASTPPSAIFPADKESELVAAWIKDEEADIRSLAKIDPCLKSKGCWRACYGQNYSSPRAPATTCWSGCYFPPSGSGTKGSGAKIFAGEISGVGCYNPPNQTPSQYGGVDQQWCEDWYGGRVCTWTRPLPPSLTPSAPPLPPPSPPSPQQTNCEKCLAGKLNTAPAEGGVTASSALWCSADAPSRPPTWFQPCYNWNVKPGYGWRNDEYGTQCSGVAGNIWTTPPTPPQTQQGNCVSNVKSPSGEKYCTAVCPP